MYPVIDQKKGLHIYVFPKYFMFKVPPTELPDEVVEYLINSWNQTDPTILESKFIEDLRKFKEEKKLLVLLERIRTFLNNLEPNASKSIIRSIYKNIHLFSKDRGGYLQSELDNAEFLMLNLINEKIEANQIEPILVEVIQETPSFEYAIRTVIACRMERGGSFFKIYENVKIDNLQKILSERLSHYFIKSRRDIFEEEKNTYGIILYHGTANKEDRKKVNEYVFSLIEKNPKYLGKIIVRFLLDWRGPLGIEIEYKDLIKLYDETKLYRKVKENYTYAYSTQQEKSALDLFIKVYEDRQASAIKEADQEAKFQDIIKAENDADILFRDKRFEEALVEYNHAIEVSEGVILDKKYNPVNLVRYRKWQCLLELSWNNGVEPHIKGYFEEACKIAETPDQLKNLFELAYSPEGHPDRVPIELSYCLFYYLQCYFAIVEERSAIKDLFVKHYKVATGVGVPGKSEEITSKCEELRKRIDTKTP